MLKTGNFPDNPKLADITPVFNRKNPSHKVNYRLANVEKLFLWKTNAKINK